MNPVARLEKSGLAPNFYRERLRLVALTGGMGAGKSRVAHYLAEHAGLPLLDCDVLARQLLEPGEAGRQALHHRFGNRFLQADGSLDRPALRQAIFADAGLRAEVNTMLHPLIRQALREQVAALAAAGRETILVEVPLLYEVGWEDDFSLVLVVRAPPEICLARLGRRDGVAPEEARMALAAQMAPEEKAARADLVIDNAGSWEETCRQLAAVEKKLVSSEKA